MKDFSLNHKTGLLFVLLALFLSASSLAQPTAFCGVDNLIHTQNLKHVPKLQHNTSESRSNNTLTIRTVVHVVYNTDEQNIPDEDIQTILSDLNDLFLTTNIDTSFINPVHQSKLTETNIQFCLASEDPFGNPTNGITRTETDSVQFQLEVFDSTSFTFSGEQHKDETTGGASPWDVSRYLNIWIIQTIGPGANINIGDPMPEHFPIINYLEEPRIPGITFDVDNFIPIEPVSFLPANILAHECGHYLGLLHTFGSNPDNPFELCAVDDEIEDTPLCDISSGCNFSYNTCEEPQDDEPDNTANFMNYGCMLMFTPDQTSTMRNNILNASPSLLTDENCSGMTTTAVSQPIFNDKAFEVFPNPNSGSFYIQLDNEVIDQDIKWSIYNVHGQEIQSEIVGDIHSIPQQVNISNAISGIYFITLKSSTASLTKK